MARPVGTEIEKRDAVTVPDARVTPGVGSRLPDDGRRQKLVGDAFGVAALDHSLGGRMARALARDQRAEGFLGPVPPGVPVHGVVAPGDGRDAAQPGGAQEFFRLPRVGQAALGRRIAAIHEGMNEEALNASPLRRTDDRLQVVDVAVHAAVAQEAHHVKRRLLTSRRVVGAAERFVAVELAASDRPVDARQILEHDAARAEAQMPDLRIADDARRQADRLARGREEGRRVGAAEPLHEARRAPGDGIAFGRVAVTPAIENDEDGGQRP